MIAERAVDLLDRDQRLDRVGIAQVHACIAAGTQPGGIQLAVQKALHDAVVVGAGEELDRHLHLLLEQAVEAGEGFELVLAERAAENADPEDRHLFAPVGCGRGGRLRAHQEDSRPQERASGNVHWRSSLWLAPAHRVMANPARHQRPLDKSVIASKPASIIGASVLTFHVAPWLATRPLPCAPTGGLYRRARRPTIALARRSAGESCWLGDCPT